MGAKYTSREKSVGKKEEGSVQSGRSFRILRRCNEVDLETYVQVACHENYRALLAEGEATEEELKQAFMEITNEFAELSGNHAIIGINYSISELYIIQAKIVGVLIVKRMIQQRHFMEDALNRLAEFGLRITVPESEKEIDRAEKRIAGYILSLELKLKRANKDFENGKQKEGGKKSTEEDFYDQLAIICRHMGFDIPMSTTLVKYASYLKDHHRLVESQIKQTKNGQLSYSPRGHR